MSGNGKPAKPPESQAARNRLHRARERVAAGKGTEDDVALIEAQTGRPLEDALKARVGRSASASKVTEFRQEERAAVAEGDHIHPDAYANIARSEGLRADTLLRLSTDLFAKVFDQQTKMLELAFGRMSALEAAHVGMLEAVRDNYLARTEAEAVAIRAAESKDGDGESDIEDFMRLMEMWQAKGGRLPEMGKRKGKGKANGKPIGSPLK